MVYLKHFGWKILNVIPDHFFCLFIPESMEEAERCLSQPNEVIWQKTGASVVLPCTASSQCSSKGFQYEWLVFKEDLYLRLNLSDSPSKYILDGGSLHIKSLNANDSGIYHCAAVSHGVQAPGSQHVGFGTTLVVNGKCLLRGKKKKKLLKGQTQVFGCVKMNWDDRFSFVFRKN